MNKFLLNLLKINFLYKKYKFNIFETINNEKNAFNKKILAYVVLNLSEEKANIKQYERQKLMEMSV